MPKPSDPLKAEVVIYTDGGAEPNPGQGGWGAILLFEVEGKRHERELSGNAHQTTNNRMEITAMLEGLKALKRPCNVLVYTDSQYLKGSVGYWNRGKPVRPTGWMVSWKARGWRRKDAPLLNDDLWKEMWKLCELQKSIQMKWVKGHSEDHYNERCDVLATEARLQLPRPILIRQNGKKQSKDGTKSHVAPVHPVTSVASPTEPDSHQSINSVGYGAKIVEISDKPYWGNSEKTQAWQSIKSSK